MSADRAQMAPLAGVYADGWDAHGFERNRSAHERALGVDLVLVWERIERVPSGPFFFTGHSDLGVRIAGGGVYDVRAWVWDLLIDGLMPPDSCDLTEVAAKRVLMTELELERALVIGQSLTAGARTPPIIDRSARPGIVSGISARSALSRRRRGEPA